MWGTGRNAFPVDWPKPSMGLADLEWRLIGEEAWDGPQNMAYDEVAAETAGDGGVSTIRVYRWQPSTLSLGYHQSSATVDWEYCADHGIGVTRRPTGGGGIYHDNVGDISYSIVAPAAALPGDLMESYRLLLEPVLAGFDRLDIPAQIADESQPSLYEPACYLRAVHSAHDVVVGGRKVSGNAQYRQKDAVIQHGSITFQRVTGRHLGVFEAPGVSAEEFDGRVTAIKDHAPGSTRADAVQAFMDALGEWVDAEPGAWTDREQEVVEEVVAEKFGSAEWTRRH